MTNNDNILQEESNLKSMVEIIIKQAKQRGASAVEVGAGIDNGFTATVRMGEVDTMEYQRDKGVGITVFFGQRKGAASTSDTTEEALQQAVHAACDIAQHTTEDACAGLADKALMAFDYPDLDLFHPWDITVEQGIQMAKECEAHGMAYDKRIHNSEGATVASHQSLHVYGNSHGFIGVVPSTRHSLSCVLLAQQGDSMQRDYDYTVARDPLGLTSTVALAESAAQRTVNRLQARRLTTRKAPVVFSAEIARSLFGSFIAAISGGNLYRESSFLLNSAGKQVFPSWLNIHERPHLPKALGSAAFDGEGVRTQDRELVVNGVCQGYVLSSYSARKLGLETTGNAGGVHNCLVEPGDQSFQELLTTMNDGLLVTEVMGHGVNIVTGDYSRGAAGFWVENGEKAYPVEEITIAANLKDMFQNIQAIAKDVDHRGNIQTGSVLIAEMRIAGE